MKPPRRASHARSGLVLLTSAALLTAAAGCTDDAAPSAAPSAGRRAPSSAEPTATTDPGARSVPLKVVVTRVSGKLPAASRPALEANVGRTVSAYVDAAFLGGDYPRSDFSGSFGSFTPGRGHGRPARPGRCSPTAARADDPVGAGHPAHGVPLGARAVQGGRRRHREGRPRVPRRPRRPARAAGPARRPAAADPGRATGSGPSSATTCTVP